MHSPYLDQPLHPVTVALPRMLARIETELPTAPPEEKRRLEMRALLIHDLLASQPTKPCRFSTAPSA